MIDLDSLRQIAEDLKREGRYWGTFDAIEHLMGWLYDEGKCLYCSVDLVGTGHTITGSATTDHLLPKYKYQRLDKDPLNAVPACVACNHIKGRHDVNENKSLFREGDSRLTPDMRSEFIVRAKDYIVETRQKRTTDFQQDLTAWQKALENRRSIG